MDKKIVVVGSMNLDLVATVPRLPAPGETLFGTGFATYSGGKGANQAVAAARLGGSVIMIGRLGRDGFGDQLHAALGAEGIDMDSVEHVPGPTGSAVILVTAAGDNSIVVIPGANSTLLPQHIAALADQLSDAAVVLAQLEIPLPTVEALAAFCAENGVPLILDPAPAAALPTSLLRNVTWLTPNETETAILLSHLGIRADGLSVEKMGEHLLTAGAKNVILKLGERGVYVCGKDAPETWIPAFPVQAVDTTAAGDAFNGGFACALADGSSPPEAARFACAVAALSVTRAGAQPSMPSRSDVEALLAH